MEPVVTLSTYEQVVDFMEPNQQHQSLADLVGPLFSNLTLNKVPINRNYKKLILKTRVVCFFYDENEYSEEIQDLEAAARKLSYRNNLRVAKVTDPKVIKHTKK